METCGRCQLKCHFPVRLECSHRLCAMCYYILKQYSLHFNQKGLTPSRKYPEKMSIYICDQCQRPLLLNEEKELQIDGETLHIN